MHRGLRTLPESAATSVNNYCMPGKERIHSITRLLSKLVVFGKNRFESVFSESVRPGLGEIGSQCFRILLSPTPRDICKNLPRTDTSHGSPHSGIDQIGSGAKFRTTDHNCRIIGNQRQRLKPNFWVFPPYANWIEINVSLCSPVF